MVPNMRSGKLPKRRSSKELYVVGRFAEDRAIWNEELQRHCGEVGNDEEETIDKQKEMIHAVQNRR